MNNKKNTLNLSAKDLEIKKKIKILFLFFCLFFLFSSCTLFEEKPYIVSINVEDGMFISDPGQFNQIQVEFSSEMNRFVTEQNIEFKNYSGSLSFQWDDSNMTCCIFLKEQLENGKKYFLIFKTGCENSNGVNIKSEYLYTIYTYNYNSNSTFSVVSTNPANFEKNIPLRNHNIIFTFSQELDNQSLKDKITIEPTASYTYQVSTDMKSINLSFYEDLRPSTVYKITFKKEILSIFHNTLFEDYIYNFTTVKDDSSFILLAANMKNQDNNIPLSINYLAENQSIDIEKDMSLILLFSHDLPIKNISSFITIDPSLQYTCFKQQISQGCEVTIDFNKDMEGEKKYRVNIKKNLTDFYLNELDREYCFFMTPDGLKSLKPVIENATHDIYAFITNNEPVINIVPLSIVANKVIFTIKFNHSIDIFKSLGYFQFEYSGGYAVTDISYDSYSWDENTSTLTLVININSSAPVGTTTYFSFIITGGGEGVVDRDGNILDNSITVVFSFDW